MALSSDDFARKLRELRDANGLSKEDAARKVGMSLRQYNRWEAGGAEPRPSSLRKVADAYGMEVAELVEAIIRKNGDLSSRLERLETQNARILELLSETLPAFAAYLETEEARGRSGARSARTRPAS